MPDERSAQAHLWLDRAVGSLAMAQQPKPADAFWEDYCYQAEQAAEKALKAVYLHLGLVFRFTHDLEELGKGLEDAGIVVDPEVKQAITLTKYASETRYPGPYEPVTEDEYHEALRLAGIVVAWARRMIEGSPDTEGT